MSRIRDAALPVAALVRPPLPATVQQTIMVFQPDHLGDILLAQPAVRRLREVFPSARLVGAVGPWSHDAAELAWPVDEIIDIAYPGFTRESRGNLLAPYRLLFNEALRLREFAPFRAYVLRTDGWWAAWLASLVAPDVVTADEPGVRDFSTSAVAIPLGEHAVSRALQIVEQGSDRRQRDFRNYPISVVPSEVSKHEACALLDRSGVSVPYGVIHPGSGAPVKEWTADRWISVGNALAADGLRVVVSGSEAEAPTCRSIASAFPGGVSLAGLTPLRTLSEVLRQATIVVGPDSGPLHLAVAVGTPTVHLFGPSDSRRYGPWGLPGRHRVVNAHWECARCGDLSLTRQSGCGCMLAIDATRVVEVIRDSIADNAE